MNIKLHLPTYCAHFSPVSIIRQTELEIAQHIRYTLVTKRLPSVRKVHLATHRIFNDVQGINSSIHQLTCLLVQSGRCVGTPTARGYFAGVCEIFRK